MITADQLKQLTSLKKDTIVEVLEKGNTPSWVYAIKKCRFLGLTNGRQFCYGIENDGRVAQRSHQAKRPEKVFISTTPTGSLVVGT